MGLFTPFNFITSQKHKRNHCRSKAYVCGLVYWTVVFWTIAKK